MPQAGARSIPADIEPAEEAAGSPSPPDGGEAMSSTVPNQHPAVVLRSHYVHLRSLLAVAMIAVIGLTVAVVLLASGDERSTGAVGAAQGAPAGVVLHSRPATVRYDGGPEEGTRGVSVAAPAGGRPDGGPEEGSAAIAR